MERILKRMKKSESAEEPRAGGLSRRFCVRSGKKDNELYRSNSFKFERFDKTNSQQELAQVGNQVSLCDDYAVPVDFVIKKRPLSIGSAQFWDKPSPHSENVEIVEVYCDPRDSKAYVEPGEEVAKLYTTPERNQPYSHPYSTGCSSPWDEEGETYEDVGGEGVVRATPYYYGDLKSSGSGSESSCQDRMSPRQGEEADMSRRKLYETAFDSKICKSDDDLDVDEVTHKSILVTGGKELCEEMRQLVLTPPSTEPLPAKFHPHLPPISVGSTPEPCPRSRELRLPVKPKHRLGLRARSCHPEPRLEIIEIKGRPRRLKYSSTESMATSSSGGSLESIRSSTSEGNRSTSSCESRRSSSLSSHSSDSTGTTGVAFPPGVTITTRVFQHKLNILSPISDKSGEPCSETSENNRNNNSERGSPEEVLSPSGEGGKKRRTPANRNLLTALTTTDPEAAQGSDSGISIESRLGLREGNCPGELADLPFDMPKLRRRRLQAQECTAQDTSGSATSVDLRDLPFDMPKLRRRLRPSPSLGAPPPPPQPSSQDCPKSIGTGRPSLSLDLQDCERRRLSLDFPPPPPLPPLPEPIDTSLPLERQGWYHGAITRLEAENILRMNKEGSFLVRNSESTKQDYSLSLKSARGFMHMRIQKCKETGRFILGQFSNPFVNIPEMIKHYSVNRLPIRGAEHMCLSHPIIEQLL